MPEDFESTGVEEVVPAAEGQETEIPDNGVTAEHLGDGVQTEPKQNNFEKAFAKRLADAQSKWQTEVSSKYGDYDTIKQQTSYLEKRARQEGFTDVNAYLRAIDEYDQQQQVERESQRMGVDPDTYQQYFAPVTQQLSELQQKVQTYEQQMTETQQREHAQQQWGELYQAYPGIVDDSRAWEKGENPSFFTQEMQDLVSMGYQPKHAYELAHKDTLFRQREQEVLARVTGRDERQVLPSTDSPNNLQFDPANMTREQRAEISKRVQNGERITF